MRKLLLATTALLALSGAARADVIIDDKLSGTGDNVIFQSLANNLLVGSFNGQHQGLVDFSCLATCGNFTGAQNGQDLKIANFSDLQVQVFQNDGVTALATSTDVFSLIGTGDVTVFVRANETDGSIKLFTFDLTELFGPLGPGQNGFTLTAINGETINSFRVVSVGGVIEDFEHYRVDVATVAAVPEASTWAMMLLGFAGVGLFGMRRRAGSRAMRMA